MKKVIKDILFGLLIVIITVFFEFLVTLPFSEIAASEDRERWAVLINRELLLTALPALLITFAFAWLLKTKTRREALQKSIIWTLVLALYYLLISIGNTTFALMFGAIGVYVLLIGAFAGPMLFAFYKRLP